MGRVSWASQLALITETCSRASSGDQSRLATAETSPEVAVHKTFKALDTVAHVLTEVTISEPSKVHAILPAEIPNLNWLRPGVPSAGQQAFGEALLSTHKFIVIPSAVSTQSWNLIFVRSTATGAYVCKSQQKFALDTRLHPPTGATRLTGRTT